MRSYSKRVLSLLLFRNQTITVLSSTGMNCGLARQTQYQIYTEGHRGHACLILTHSLVNLKVLFFAWTVYTLTIGTFEKQIVSLWSQWTEGGKPTCFANKPSGTTDHAYVRLVLVFYWTSRVIIFLVLWLWLGKQRDAHSYPKTCKSH